ncbi:uncharacterized protein LODBEIA_P19120 [Lodderomyces beijingensis]|uniref:Cysteine dioxygenase n=1 Tax=Lodderomyces beijingensis TaxID=1775926 RepID=A0ABP0ZHR4_9ASCO
MLVNQTRFAESLTPSLPSTPVSQHSQPPLFNQKFSQLIDSLRDELKGHGLTSADIDIKKIKQIMESYHSDPADWAHLALHDPSRNYSRNGIVNINGNANLLILVWSPRRSSAIHDHANAHCCMKILQGELTESLYRLDSESKPQLFQETTLNKQDVGYIADDIGLHKITNTSNEASVSLHLYTPPYASMYGCSMYELNGTKHHVDMSKYYSWQGKLIDADGLHSSSC